MTGPPLNISPSVLRAYARRRAQERGLDSNIVEAQIQQESGFEHFDASGNVKVSSAGARGVAQIVPRWHPSANTDDPYAAIDYLIDLDAKNYAKYGDWDRALAAYNAGGPTVDKYNGVPPFEETQRYVRNILGRAPATAYDVDPSIQRATTAQATGPALERLPGMGRLLFGEERADGGADEGPVVGPKNPAFPAGIPRPADQGERTRRTQQPIFPPLQPTLSEEVAVGMGKAQPPEPVTFRPKGPPLTMQAPPAAPSVEPEQPHIPTFPESIGNAAKWAWEQLNNSNLGKYPPEMVKLADEADPELVRSELRTTEAQTQILQRQLAMLPENATPRDAFRVRKELEDTQARLAQLVELSQLIETRQFQRRARTGQLRPGEAMARAEEATAQAELESGRQLTGPGGRQVLGTAAGAIAGGMALGPAGAMAGGMLGMGIGGVALQGEPEPEPAATAQRGTLTRYIQDAGAWIDPMLSAFPPTVLPSAPYLRAATRAGRFIQTLGDVALNLGVNQELRAFENPSFLRAARGPLLRAEARTDAEIVRTMQAERAPADVAAQSAETNLAVDQAVDDWRAQKLYADRNGDFHLRTVDEAGVPARQRGPIADYSSTLKKAGVTPEILDKLADLRSGVSPQRLVQRDGMLDREVEEYAAATRQAQEAQVRADALKEKMWAAFSDPEELAKVQAEYTYAERELIDAQTRYAESWARLSGYGEAFGGGDVRLPRLRHVPEGATTDELARGYVDAASHQVALEDALRVAEATRTPYTDNSTRESVLAAVRDRNRINQLQDAYGEVVAERDRVDKALFNRDEAAWQQVHDLSLADLQNRYNVTPPKINLERTLYQRRYSGEAAGLPLDEFGSAARRVGRIQQEIDLEEARLRVVGVNPDRMFHPESADSAMLAQQGWAVMPEHLASLYARREEALRSVDALAVERLMARLPETEVFTPEQVNTALRSMVGTDPIMREVLRKNWGNLNDGDVAALGRRLWTALGGLDIPIAERDRALAEAQEVMRAIVGEDRSATRPYSRANVERDLIEKFGQPPEQARVLAGISDRVAATWSRLTGRPAEEWWPQYVASVVRGNAEEANGLLQVDGRSVEAFYHASLRALNSIKGARATVGQYRAALSPKNGVKPEELRWTGIGEWLDDQEATFGNNGVLDKEAVRDALELRQVRVLTSEESTVRREVYSNVEMFGTEDDVLNSPQVRAVRVGDAMDPWEFRRRFRQYVDSDVAENYWVVQTRNSRWDDWRVEDWHEYEEDAKEQAKDMLGGGVVTVEPPGGSSQEYFARPSFDNSKWLLYKRGNWGGSPDYTIENIGGLENSVSRWSDEEFGGIESGGTQYSQYVVPGMEDYTELVISLPLRTFGINEVEEAGKHFVTSGGNTLFHVRFGYLDGRLVVDEVQSDWFQAGRNKGFRTAEEQAEVERLDNERMVAYQVLDSIRREYQRAMRASSAAIALRARQEYERTRDLSQLMSPKKATVDPELQIRYDNAQARLSTATKAYHDFSDGLGPVEGPLAKTWHETAIRRMIRWAAEGGDNEISFMSAQPHIDRWKTDIFAWVKTPDGYQLYANPYIQIDQIDNARAHFTTDLWSGQLRGEPVTSEADVRALVGAGGMIDPSLQSAERTARRLWEKMQASDADVWMPRYEGMQAFYGTGEAGKGQVPRYLEQWAKQWSGATVTPGTVYDGDGAKIPVMTLKITPEMRQSILANGVALFQRDFETPQSRPYVSQLGGAIGRMAAEAPGGATGERWLSQLQHLQVKPNELAWTGMDEWLRAQPRGKKLTADEVQRAFVQRQVWLEEAWLGEGGKARGEYGTYVLPGGARYRELLVKYEPEQWEWTQLAADQERLEKLIAQQGADSSMLPVLQAQYDDNARRILEIDLAASRGRGSSFYSPHFGQEGTNLLAHLRATDRNMADGAEALFLEEVQSDWLQQASQEGGFRSRFTPEEQKRKARIEQLWGEGRSSEVTLADTDWYNSVVNDRSVPPAPFLDTWHELMARRALYQAVLEGKGVLAWGGGDVHWQRWSTNAVRWTKNEDGSWDVMLSPIIPMTGDIPGIIQRPHDLNNRQNGTPITVRSLEDIPSSRSGWGVNTDTETQDLQRRLWEKIQKSDEGLWMPRKEGLETFYDQKLTGYLRKFARQYGGEVGRAEVITRPGVIRYNVIGEDGSILRSFTTRGGAENYAALARGDVGPPGNPYYQPATVTEEVTPAETRTVWSVTITPQMQDSVLKNGVTLFQRPNDYLQDPARLVSFRENLKTPGGILAELRAADLWSAEEVARYMGTRPAYLDSTIEYMNEQRAKLLQGEITPREVAKAWVMAIMSQQATEQRPEALTANYRLGRLFEGMPEAFLSTVRDGSLRIRPEEAAAAWFFSPDGQRALDSVDAGAWVPQYWRGWEGIETVRKAFGSPQFQTLNVFGGRSTKTAGFRMEHIAEVTRLINEAGADLLEGNSAKLDTVIRRMNGLGDGKVPFLKFLLGLGDAPTIDAVEMNLWIAGHSTAERSEQMARRGRPTTPLGDIAQVRTPEAALAEAVKNWSAKSEPLAFEVRRLIEGRLAELGGKLGINDPDSPNYMDPQIASAILHHWLWDVAKQTETTHNGMYLAMKFAQEDQRYQSTARGSVTFREDGKAIIQAFEGANFSTWLHEMAHIWRRSVLALSDADLQVASRWAGADNPYHWSVEAEEKWARGVERYLREGATLGMAVEPPEVLSLFEQVRQWMTEVYHYVIGSPIDVEIPREMRDIFDGLFGLPSEATQGGNARAFADNMARSGAVDERLRAQIADDLRFTYDTVNNREIVDEAVRMLRDETEKAVERSSETSALGMALSLQRILAAQRDGDYQTAGNVAADLAARLTLAGQFVQAASILGRLTPEGVLVFAAREVQRATSSEPIPFLKMTPGEAGEVVRRLHTALSGGDITPEHALRLFEEVVPQQGRRQLTQTQARQVALRVWELTREAERAQARQTDPDALIFQEGGRTITVSFDSEEERLLYELHELTRGRITGAGSPAEPPPTLFQPIPVEIARTLNTSLRLPDTEEFRAAVTNTPGARLTDDGLVLQLQRGQKEDQEGYPSIRSGVHYVPQATGRNPYQGKGTMGGAYGGSQRITGETLVKAPLVVNGGLGGRSMQVAYDAIVGKGKFETMQTDVGRMVMGGFGRRLNEQDTIDGIYQALLRFAPGILDGKAAQAAEEIYWSSDKRTDSNQLVTAVTDRILAHMARAAGYDSIISMGSRRGGGGKFFNEFFDLRENRYPSAEGDFSVAPEFRAPDTLRQADVAGATTDRAAAILARLKELGYDEKTAFARGAEVHTAVRRRVDSLSGRSEEAGARAKLPANYTRAVGQNQSYDFRYKVVPMDDLVPSHTDAFSETAPELYPPELQPRNRSAAAAREQVVRNATGFNPDEVLTDFHSLDRGPMIVGPDHLVESGNGRVLTLRMMRNEGMPGWQAYQEQLSRDIREYGLSRSDLAGVTNPVLVRERTTPLSTLADRRAFAQEANRPTVLGQNRIERAKQDADLLDDGLIAQMVDVENATTPAGLLRASANRDVARTFLSRLDPNDAAQLVDANGALTDEAANRLGAALFLRVYSGGAGERLARNFFGSLDPTLGYIRQGLLGSLGKMAQAEELIRTGQRSYDLSLATDLAAAGDVLTRLRAKGKTARWYVEQGQLFDRELTPLQEQIMIYLEEVSGRSSRPVRELLDMYADKVKDAPLPGQGGFFGDAPVATKEGLLEAAIHEQGYRDATQTLAERAAQVATRRAEAAEVRESERAAREAAVQARRDERLARRELARAQGDIERGKKLEAATLDRLERDNARTMVREAEVEARRAQKALEDADKKRKATAAAEQRAEQRRIEQEQAAAARRVRELEEEERTQTRRAAAALERFQRSQAGESARQQGVAARRTQREREAEARRLQREAEAPARAQERKEQLALRKLAEQKAQAPIKEQLAAAKAEARDATRRTGEFHALAVTPVNALKMFDRAVGEVGPGRFLPDDAKRRMVERAKGLVAIPPGRKRVMATALLMRDINELTPASLSAKGATLQVIDQLLNARTIGRNTISNTFFAGTENLSQVLAAGADLLRASTPLVGSGHREVGFPSLVGPKVGGHRYGQIPGFLRGAREGFEEAIHGVQLSAQPGQVERMGGARTFRTSFSDVTRGGNPLRMAARIPAWIAHLAETGLNIGLRVSDKAFYQAAVDGAIPELAWIHAYNQGHRGQALSLKSTEYILNPPEAVLAAAHQRGMYRTFQNDSALASAAMALKEALNIVGTGPVVSGRYIKKTEMGGRTIGTHAFGLGNLELNYPRVPSNLIMAALDYSPVGFLRAAPDMLGWLLRRDMTQKQVAERIARSLVGTVGFLAPAYVLGSLGILTAQGDKDPDVRDAQRQAGVRDFSLNVSALKRTLMDWDFSKEKAASQSGDAWYTYEWAPPLSTLIAAGATLGKGKARSSRVDRTPTEAAADFFGQWIGEPAAASTEVTMLGLNFMADQGVLRQVRDMFGGRDFASIAADVVADAPGQFVPSLLYQYGQLLDNTMYDTQNEDWIQEASGRFLARIPGLAGTAWGPQGLTAVPPQRTSLGQPRERFVGDGNTFWQVFLDPGVASQYLPPAELEWVKGIAEAAGTVTAYPRVAPKTLQFKDAEGVDKTWVLTPGERDEYQSFAGELTRRTFSALRNSDTFREATDKDKAALLQGALSTVAGEAKKWIVAKSARLNEGQNLLDLPEVRAERAVQDRDDKLLADGKIDKVEWRERHSERGRVAHDLFASAAEIKNPLASAAVDAAVQQAAVGMIERADTAAARGALLALAYRSIPMQISPDGDELLDDYFAKREEFLAALPIEDRSEVSWLLRKNMTETEKQWEAAKEDLRPYWEAKNEIFRRLPFTKTQVDRVNSLPRGTLQRAIAEDHPAYKEYQKQVGLLHEALRARPAIARAGREWFGWNAMTTPVGLQ